MKHLTLLFGLFVAIAAASESRLEVIELTHRDAREMVNLITPVVDADLQLGGQGDRLIVRGTGPEIAEVRDLVRRFDTPPVSLKITMRRERTSARDGHGGGTDGRRVEIYSSSSARDGSETRSVRALEGRPARFSGSVLVPITDRTVAIGRKSTGYTESTRLVELENGFQAVARVHGGRAHIDILAAEADPSSLEQESIVTTVTGPLGQWIPLAGTAQNDTENERGLVYRSRDARRSDSQVSLKVERLDGR